MLLAPSVAAAHGLATDRGLTGPSAGPTSATHFGSSPFAPPEEEDTQFVVDQGPGLDTGCTFRNGGPLRISLNVKRYVGPVSADGTLLNPESLKSQGFISHTASLRFPAFDIDVNAQIPGIAPEHDRAYFNGHDLGLLSGDNQIWKVNEFRIPIEWIKFPQAGALGQAPTPAENILEIRIDESNATEEWCMAVDWVQISFDAIAPVALVHGINAQADTWNPDFRDYFSGLGMPWSNQINLAENGSVAGNAGLLNTQLTAIATSFGAKRIHLVCHSKGGLDTRSYLGRFHDPDKLKVQSVFTLSTPHHGAVIADITVAARNNVDPRSSNADIQRLISTDWWIPGGFTPQEPGLLDLQTGAARTFNSTHPAPGSVAFYGYGADADLNNNRTMQSNEIEGMIPTWLPGATAAGTAMYRTLGNVATVTVTRRSRFWGMDEWTEIEVGSTNPSFLENDLAVTTASATAPFGSYLGTRNANHSTLKSTALAQQILARIKADFPVTANP
jgi:hypothetical protein